MIQTHDNHCCCYCKSTEYSYPDTPSLHDLPLTIERVHNVLRQKFIVIRSLRHLGMKSDTTKSITIFGYTTDHTTLRYRLKGITKQKWCPGPPCGKYRVCWILTSYFEDSSVKFIILFGQNQFHNISQRERTRYYRCVRRR